MVLADYYYREMQRLRNKVKDLQDQIANMKEEASITPSDSIRSSFDFGELTNTTDGWQGGVQHMGPDLLWTIVVLIFRHPGNSPSLTGAQPANGQREAGGMHRALELSSSNPSTTSG